MLAEELKNADSGAFGGTQESTFSPNFGAMDLRNVSEVFTVPDAAGPVANGRMVLATTDLTCSCAARGGPVGGGAASDVARGA